MSVKLKIKVTRDIYERSANCPANIRSSGCAIAEAVREVFPDATVGRHTMLFDRFTQSFANLPAKARKMTFLFDQSTSEQRALLPEFEFEIDVPDEVINKIDISDIEKCSTLELVK